MLKSRFYLALLTIAIITLIAYCQVYFNSFISYDDPLYITNNPHILEGISFKNILWAFTTNYAFNWHPLTWISHMLDIQLFGLDPAGHHLTSLIIHIANTVLLAILLQQLTKLSWQSLAVATLFAIHPMHVESVAWVAERKDVLCGLFWLLTILIYIRFVEKPGAYNYLVLIFIFALGLMSKSMMVTLPIVLLLLDYWPLCRFSIVGGHISNGRLFKEKIPLLLMSTATGIISLVIQKSDNNAAQISIGPLYTNLVKATNSYCYYIFKLLWPANFAIVYPFEPDRIPLWQTTVSIILLITVTALAVGARRKRPYVFVGWLWFLTTLLPVSGIVSIGSHFIADRYSYIPFIGLFIILSWGFYDLMPLNWRSVNAIKLLPISVFVTLSFLTYKNVTYWKDSITLYNHAIAVTDRNWVIYNNLGVQYLISNQFDKASTNFLKALRFNPYYTDAYINMGSTNRSIGNYLKSIEYYKYALKLEPENLFAHMNLAKVYFEQNDITNFTSEYNIITKLSPAYSSQLNLLTGIKSNK